MRRIYSITAESDVARLLNLGMVAANAVGALIYVIAASPSWALPQERDLPPHITGEPFVWAGAILPILAIFLILNLTWFAITFTYRRWRFGRLWVLVLPIWFVAIVIDFAHH